MRNHLTAYDIANEIRMARQQFRGTFVIIEGKTDSRLYRRLFDEVACRLIPAHGKENAVQSLEILDSDNVAGVLAIVDADFWRLDGFEHPSDNLFVTDTHDLETMMLASPAFEKLLDEYGSAQKIAEFQQEQGEIRQRLLETGRPLGYLRWVSLREGYDFKFSGLDEADFRVFVAVKPTLQLNINKLIKKVKDKSQRHEVDDEQLFQAIERLSQDDHNLWDVCSGHDLVRIIAIGLRKLFGSNDTGQVKVDALEKGLRLGYETAYFYQTVLYRSLKQWEFNRSRFQLFPIQKQQL